MSDWYVSEEDTQGRKVYRDGVKQKGWVVNEKRNKYVFKKPGSNRIIIPKSFVDRSMHEHIEGVSDVEAKKGLLVNEC